MATAKVFTTSKRHNSTLVPTGSTDITVYLKDGCDLLTPTFKINQAAVPAWSMILFEGRYYFVTGVRSVRNDLWEVDCSVDVLATYKSNITGSSQFVEYANTTNTEIVDGRLPTKTTATKSTNYATIDASLMTGQWRCAVTCAGDDGTATYLLTPAQVRQLVNSTDMQNWFNQLWQDVVNESNQADSDMNLALTSAGNINADAQTVSTEVQGLSVIGRGVATVISLTAGAICAYVKATITSMAKFFRKVIATPNALDCIKSAVYIPWEVAGDGVSDNIMLGEFDTGVQAAPVVNPTIHNQVTINIPWQASDWRRNAPYHHIYLYLPFMGSVELSPSDLIGETALKIYWSLNIVNGAMNYRVATNSNDVTIGVFSCSCGVPYPIGASNITPGTLFNAVGGAAAAIAGSASIGAAALAYSSLASIRPSASCVGGGGGGAGSGLDLRAIISTVFHDTDDAPSNPSQSIGVPVSKRMALSGISGYVKCREASVSGAMTDTERELINNLLNGGIFIE